MDVLAWLEIPYLLRPLEPSSDAHLAGGDGECAPLGGTEDLTCGEHDDGKRNIKEERVSSECSC